jgi:hypothetical protein
MPRAAPAAGGLPDQGRGPLRQLTRRHLPGCTHVKLRRGAHVASWAHRRQAAHRNAPWRWLTRGEALGRLAACGGGGGGGGRACQRPVLAAAPRLGSTAAQSRQRCRWSRRPPAAQAGRGGAGDGRSLNELFGDWNGGGGPWPPPWLKGGGGIECPAEGSHDTRLFLTGTCGGGGQGCEAAALRRPGRPRARQPPRASRVRSILNAQRLIRPRDGAAPSPGAAAAQVHARDLATANAKRDRPLHRPRPYSRTNLPRRPGHAQRGALAAPRGARGSACAPWLWPRRSRCCRAWGCYWKSRRGKCPLCPPKSCACRMIQGARPAKVASPARLDSWGPVACAGRDIQRDRPKIGLGWRPQPAPWCTGGAGISRACTRARARDSALRAALAMLEGVYSLIRPRSAPGRLCDRAAAPDSWHAACSPRGAATAAGWARELDVMLDCCL